MAAVQRFRLSPLIAETGSFVDPKTGKKDDNFQVYADPAGHPFCLCWIQRPDEQ